MRSRSVIWRVRCGRFRAFARRQPSWSLPAAILDFEKNEKFFRRVVPRVKQYVHAKFCLDPINRIEVIASRRKFLTAGKTPISTAILNFVVVAKIVERK